MKTITEIWGRPSSGKTYSSHAKWPNPLHIDTALVQINTAEHEITTVGGEKGESWSTVASIHDWDVEEAESHYRHAKSLNDIEMFVDMDDGEHDTVIIDNTKDLRSMAIMKFLNESDNAGKWIQRHQYSAVNTYVESLIHSIKARGYHVVIVTNMTEEYNSEGNRTGDLENKSPNNAMHFCDIRVGLDIQDGERSAWVHKNRFVDAAGEAYASEGSELHDDWSLEDFFLASDIPDGEREV